MQVKLVKQRCMLRAKADLQSGARADLQSGARADLQRGARADLQRGASGSPTRRTWLQWAKQLGVSIVDDMTKIAIEEMVMHAATGGKYHHYKQAQMDERVALRKKYGNGWYTYL